MDMFQHTAARRRLGPAPCRLSSDLRFQHAAARRRLERLFLRSALRDMFQHAAARRRLGSGNHNTIFHNHSFNTQPPEGGWTWRWATRRPLSCFNTQPPEGGWTHFDDFFRKCQSFNTQPPEGGWPSGDPVGSGDVQFQHAAARRRLAVEADGAAVFDCFNTQPPEGGWVFGRTVVYNRRSFNTQPPEGGWWLDNFFLMRDFLFQHAAARRRLGRSRWRRWWANRVSTRSRPKAAGSCRL